jgi:pyruvate kinase
MNRIARETEQSDSYAPRQGHRHRDDLDLSPAAARSDAHAVARAAKALAEALPARLIVVLTTSGRTAGIVASERPGVPIVAITESEDVARRLALWHGVVPIVADIRLGNNHTVPIDAILRAHLLVTPGDRVVVVRSTPRPPKKGSISLEIHRTAASLP